MNAAPGSAVVRPVVSPSVKQVVSASVKHVVLPSVKHLRSAGHLCLLGRSHLVGLFQHLVGLFQQ